MAPVCAQMAGMGNTVHWKVVLETAMAMVPAVCQTTSRGGNVCARVDGMELDVISGSNKTVMTRQTMIMVNITSLLMIILIDSSRWTCGLWGSRMLWVSSLWTLSVVSHRLCPYWHSTEEAASCGYSLLLWEDEVHHRGPRSSELCQEERIQWKVGVVQLRLVAVSLGV